MRGRVVVTGDRDDGVEGELMALAAAGTRLDPVPPEAFQAAIASFVCRCLDAELAELTFDSARDFGELVGVRSERGQRALTFESPELTIEMQIDEGPDGELVGQLVPPVAADIDIRSPDATVTVSADQRGLFWASRLPGRFLSLRIQRPGSGIDWVTTPWITTTSAKPQ
jgi:hypothetical protein